MNKIRGSLIGAASLACVALLSSCAIDSNATNNDQQTTNQILTQLERVEPIPVFNWSLRRSEMIQLYEAQNKNVTTYSYIMSNDGKVENSCPSLGWPIPGGTQLTNPQQTAGYNYAVAIQQAEPDGLFPPSNSQGTYIMCVNADGTVSPVYAEPYVLTFPQPMQVDAQGRLVPVSGSKPSVSINPAPPANVSAAPVGNTGSGVATK